MRLTWSWFYEYRQDKHKLVVLSHDEASGEEIIQTFGSELSRLFEFGVWSSAAAVTQLRLHVNQVRTHITMPPSLTQHASLCSHDPLCLNVCRCTEVCAAWRLERLFVVNVAGGSFYRLLHSWVEFLLNSIKLHHSIFLQEHKIKNKYAYWVEVYQEPL